jgi:hypothetical protein
METMLAFGRSKLRPYLGTTIDVVYGKDITGESTIPTDYIF